MMVFKTYNRSAIAPVRPSISSSKNDIIYSSSLTTFSGGSTSGSAWMWISPLPCFAYPEPVALIIDDKLPAGLVAGIPLLRTQILVEDVGGEGHPLEAGQPL